MYTKLSEKYKILIIILNDSNSDDNDSKFRFNKSFAQNVQRKCFLKIGEKINTLSSSVLEHHSHDNDDKHLLE